MSNPFLAHAESLRVDRGRARRISKLVNAKAPMVPSPAEKAVREMQAEFSAYEKTVNKERKALIESGMFSELIKIIKRLDTDSARELVEAVQSVDWQRHGEDDRYVLLSMIDTAIMRIRVRQGQAPLDDPLPGEEPNVFLVIRKILTGV